MTKLKVGIKMPKEYVNAFKYDNLQTDVKQAVEYIDLTFVSVKNQLEGKTKISENGLKAITELIELALIRFKKTKQAERILKTIEL